MNTLPTRTLVVPSWPWPLPALGAWAAAWTAWGVLISLGGEPGAAWAGGAAVGALLAMGCQGRWRRGLCAAGFPLSAFMLGAAADWPAWAWLALLLPLLLAYPLRAWRDAPFFPTPAAALRDLPRVVGRPARVFDAGCGLGHGLRALHDLWPQARAEGVEWSPLLSIGARVTCPWARVRRGDMWARSWAGQDLVYVFQRPESMPRVWAKACAELGPGAWLVSLEFAVPGVAPWARLQADGQRPLWIYRPQPASPDSTGDGPGR
jgi:SAM-dependent methyltransferase